MGRKRLKIVVDHRTVMLFLDVACELIDDPALDVFPDSERHAARLLVMLAAIGEFQVLISAAQAARVIEALEHHGVGPLAIHSIWESLEKAIRVFPDDAGVIDRSFSTGSGLPAELAILKAGAELAGANVVVSPLAGSDIDMSANVVSCCGFFTEVKRRYGFDYAELAFENMG